MRVIGIDIAMSGGTFIDIEQHRAVPARMAIAEEDEIHEVQTALRTTYVQAKCGRLIGATKLIPSTNG